MISNLSSQKDISIKQLYKDISIQIRGKNMLIN